MEFCDDDNQLMIYRNDADNGLTLICRKCHKQRPVKPDSRIFSRELNTGTKYVQEKQNRIKDVAIQSPIFRKTEHKCPKCANDIAALLQNNQTMRVQFICTKCKNVTEAVPGDKIPTDW